MASEFRSKSNRLKLLRFELYNREIRRRILGGREHQVNHNPLVYEGVPGKCTRSDVRIHTHNQENQAHGGKAVFYDHDSRLVAHVVPSSRLIQVCGIGFSSWLIATARRCSRFMRTLLA